MEEEMIKIKRENVLAAYETARKTCAYSTMKALEALFGEDTFKPKDVRERIRTFKDAMSELGNKHPLVIQYNEIFDNFLEGAAAQNSSDIIAYLKLRIICAALNEGWEPQFTEGEWRYYPWFCLYTRDEIERMDEQQKQDRNLMFTGDYITDYAGFGCASSSYAPSYPIACIGSRLCLKSEALAAYFGKQFIDFWADLCLITK